MANVLGELFGNIADAIREKTGSTGTMKPAAFPDAIRGIETGGASETDILPETTLEGFVVEGGTGQLQTAADYTLTVAEVYYVVWDGIEYRCVAQDMSTLADGAVGLGNLIGFGGTGNEEPFTLGVMGSVAMYVAWDDAATSHTVRIYQKSEVEIETVIVGGVDPYYRKLAEAVLMREAEYLSGDQRVMDMKGFVMSNGLTLGAMVGYAFAGFDWVEYMAFSDVSGLYENCMADDSSLKIIDVTVTSALPYLSVQAGALNGCTSLEALIVRGGTGGLEKVLVNTAHGANNTFLVYVPRTYYDTVISNLTSGYLGSDRFRILENYPNIDSWPDTI